jgi:hypothetical protein
MHQCRVYGLRSAANRNQLKRCSPVWGTNLNTYGSMARKGQQEGGGRL